MIKIAITGPESTGKSFLAKAMAKHYKTVWVKEFARDYLAEIQRPYTFDDVTYIAQKQARLEIEMAKTAEKFLFCDTDMLVCKIWQEFVFGKISAEVEALFQDNTYQFTLLCDIDLPWKPDALREHPDKRAEIMNLYKHHLHECQRPYCLISGLGEERVQNAIEVLDKSIWNYSELDSE